MSQEDLNTQEEAVELDELTGIEQGTVIDMRDALSRGFGDYARYTIQERGLPDLRDGLLPVQRRILYGMNEMGNIHSKPMVKAARSVGEVMGKYHPHGDSSIYGAMMRLSKDWVLNYPLIEPKGNNGSIDGDSYAAMRYVELRLSKIANYLLDNIHKKGLIEWGKNFDDSLDEPKYLPAQYPNILIGGVNSISTGYASKIPPHNLKEILKAAILLLDNPNTPFKDLGILGPDLPTGGVIINGKEAERIYSVGKGTFRVRGRYTVEQDTKRSKTKRVVFTEIPYESKKPDIEEAIHKLLNNKQLNGVVSVQDESDKDGIRFVITVTRDTDVDLLTDILFKKTPLQGTVNLNMTVIDQGRPYRMGIIPLLNKFNAFRLGIVQRELEADNEVDKKRLHILEGLFVLAENTDAIIKLVKESSSKGDARTKLMTEFGISELQANAILELQVHRMSQVSLDEFKNEHAEVSERVSTRDTILASEELLKETVKVQYQDILEDQKKVLKRKTKVLKDVKEVEIKLDALIQKEEVYVGVTPTGFIKRSTARSYTATDKEGFDEFAIKTTTHDHVILWTDKGQYMYYPVHELDDMRWGDEGVHASRLGAELDEDETFIGISEYKKDANYLLVRTSGKGKLGKAEELEVARFRKTYSCGSVKDGERVVCVGLIDPSETIELRTSRYLKTTGEVKEESLVVKVEDIGEIGVKAYGRLLVRLGKSKTLESVSIVGSEGIDEVGKASNEREVIYKKPSIKFNQMPQPFTNESLLESELVEESEDLEEDDVEEQVENEGTSESVDLFE